LVAGVELIAAWMGPMIDQWVMKPKEKR
jgi:hypothetical protein